MGEVLKVSGLNKHFALFPGPKVLIGCQDVHLVLGRGEFVGITGRSGSGKSTILKCIYRTYLPQSGHIWYDSARFGSLDLAKASERRIAHLRRQEIGYVSQFLSVLPRITAREIVESAMLDDGLDLPQVRQATEKLLAHFELDCSLWDVFPQTFSGGEKLRLNIARAMAKKPRLLLLDEPTASLDHESKARVKELLVKLKTEGTSLLGIFHDLEFMDGVCDRVLAMSAGRLTAQNLR
ncbi:MAG: Alpha-D-ribose 1-methylphosphonate 5-triphosphate synthase subunit PhnL [Firmicutes bacterium]|nr:Alpha-D-ribose 1-methylphosphonate 5-triphosphate synthase subunit PhnL [Bacillota bacterium]